MIQLLLSSVRIIGHENHKWYISFLFFFRYPLYFSYRGRALEIQAATCQGGVSELYSKKHLSTTCYFDTTAIKFWYRT